MAAAAAAAGGGGASAGASGGSGAAGAAGSSGSLGSLGVPGADLSALNSPINLRTSGSPFNQTLGQQSIGDRVFDPKQHGYPDIPDMFGGPDIQLPFPENSPFFRQGPQSHGIPEEGDDLNFDSTPENEAPPEPAPPEAKTPAQRRKSQQPEGRENSLQGPDKVEPAPDERLQDKGPESGDAASPRETTPPQRRQENAPEGRQQEQSPARPQEPGPDQRQQLDGPPGTDGKSAGEAAPKGGEPRPEDRRNEGDKPQLEQKVEALTTGTAAGFFGITFDSALELSIWVLSIFPQYAEEIEAARDAREELRTFSEAAGDHALKKDETFGMIGIVIGGGAEALSPGGKVKAAGAGANATIKGGKTLLGMVAKKSKTVVKSSTKKGKKSASKTAKKKANDPPDFDRFDDMKVVPGMERHHVALQAIFKRAKDPAVQSILRELRAVPLSPDTHRTLHKIINNRLKRARLMPGSKGRGTKDAFTNKEIQKALKVIEDEYRKEGVVDFADHIQGMRNAMRNAGLFN